jgi:hypothetical protein
MYYDDNSVNPSSRLIQTRHSVITTVLTKIRHNILNIFIVESCVKHHIPNPDIYIYYVYIQLSKDKILCLILVNTVVITEFT